MGGVEDSAREVDQVLFVQELEDLLVQLPQTPARDQMANRRCTVDFDAPKQGGKARQAQPLTST